MVNFYNSKNVERNFDPDFEANARDSFMSAFASLFGNLKSTVVIMFMMLAVCQLSWSQSTGNYAFTTNSTSSLALDANGNTVDMSSGTTQLVGAGADASASAVTNIGFNFIFMGNTYTQYSINEDGQLKLGGTVVGTNSYSITPGTAAAPYLSAFNADLRTGTTTGKVHYKLVGTAPNRTLVVEFKDMQLFYTTAAAGTSTWQMRLYETSGIVEYVYGTVNVSNIASANRLPSIGFYTGAGTNLFASVLYATQTVSVTSPFAANPAVAATGDIAALSSAADGSRRMYRFTPSSVTPADPTTLTFTAITATTITPNWVDNSTNESFFIVTRATDPAFSQNVVTTIVNSTSTGTTGTAYNLAQTGLFPLTTYYFKIQSSAEAAIPSTGLTGSEMTLGGTTYYWVGTTGGNLSTAANWNTAADGTGSTRTAAATSDILIVDGDGFVAGGATRIVVDIASFSIGQFKVTNNTACSLESNSTTTRTITLIGGAGDDFSIDSGSSLLLNHAANAVAFSFSGIGLTGLINGTYTASGSTSNVITTTGGTGTVFTVSSTGVINNSIVGGSGCLTGSAPTLVFADGSNYTHSSYTTSNAYIPTATWGANSNATLNGGTTGTGLTSGSTALGNLTINSTTLTATLSAFTSATRTIQGNLTIQATNTGKFRAVTSGSLTINGNLIVNGGYFDVASSTGTVIVNGLTTVNAGATFDINSGNFQQNGMTFTNNGTLTGVASTARLNFASPTNTPQTFGGTGTVLTNIGGLGVTNTGGLTISHTGQIPTLRVNLIAGTITNSNKLTMGTGAALAVTTQIGNAGLLTQGGFFDQSPVWNLGTGTYTLLYQEESVARTSGFEVPPTRTATNMTVANPNGLTLTGGNLEVGSALTMTSGIVTTSAGNVLSLGTATAAGTLTGGSATAYVKGPFARTIASGNANSNYILYPVGKTAYNPISLAPATTALSVMKAEAFDTNTGTVDASIMTLSSKRWEAPLVSGTITNINVRLGDAGISAVNIPVQAPSAAGIYTSTFGSTATYAAGTPNTTTSNATAASGSYTGYLAYAVSNACSGTPAPGATTTTASAICFGGSVTLGITTIPAGSGITYQWQSSPDGVTYSNIASANGVTYVATPTANTYYQCVVTCSAGPVSGTSTPIQITFSKAVLTSTPGSHCGTGTVNLAATATAGDNVIWYTAQTGGTPLATGTTFTTPSISATTTYYAAAETAGSLVAVLGNGATNSSSVGESFFPGSWGGAKTQYIIRASELTSAGFTAGNISSLGFEPTTSGQTYQGFYVNIGHTSNTTAPTTTFLSSGLTQVYAGTGANGAFTPAANSLNTLSFGTGAGSASSFYWDGVSNIVVSISWSSVPSASTAVSSTMKVDNVGFVSSAYRQRDSVTPAAMLAETSVNSTTSIRPRFTINGQVICSSPRVAVVATISTPPAFALSSGTTTICNGSSSSAITVATGAADYDTYMWSPATGVTGNAGSGWVFSPTATTTYTLTASQSSGSLCVTTATVNVTVNPLPSAMTIAPVSASVCQDAIQSLTVSGGLGSTAVLGTDVTTNTTTGYPSPFSNYYGGTKHQMLIRASELTAMGLSANMPITSIAFDVTAVGTTFSGTLQNFQVDMGLTGSTVLTGTSFLTTTANVRAASALPVAVGVNTVNLTGGFVWDGVSNLLVQTSYSNANSGTTTDFVQMKNSDPGFVSTNWYRADSVSAASILTAVTPTSSGNARPNIVLKTSLTGTYTWSPLTDLYADPAGTVAYTGTDAATVYFKSNTVGAGTYTATATTSSNCTRTATVGVTVTPNRTIALSSSVGSDAQTVCINTAIMTITYTVANATNATVSGLPAGVTGSYAAGVLTISGTPTAAGTFNYTVTPVGCGTATATGSIVVNQTAAPTASSQTFCNSATVANLAATGTATQWYAGPTGGTALLSTDALATGTYYVTQTVSGCESPRLAVSVTVNVTAQPTTSSQTFCNSATVADLSATGTAIQWYAGPTGGAALLSTDALATGTYYVTQTVSGCESPRLAVSVTLNVTAQPTASSQTFCNSATVANLAATGTAIQWYAGPTGGTALLSTDALATGTYYVTQTVSGCESPRLAVSVTVNVTAQPTASSQTFCNSATVANLAATGTAIQWYAGPTGGTALLSTDALATGTYYVTQTVSGCESPRLAVSVTVNVVNAPTGASTQTISVPVASDATIEDIVVTGSNIIWYPTAADALAGTNALAPGTQLVSGSVYYATQTVGGCTSTSSLAVTITVTLGVKDFALNSLKLYPNPVTDVLTIENAQAISGVEIYNVAGQKVMVKAVNAITTTIDMSGLAGGAYLIKVTSDDAVKTVKVIKK